jgi:multidrug efflux pump subunit AcrA (membrane-fusion protein)
MMRLSRPLAAVLAAGLLVAGCSRPRAKTETRLATAVAIREVTRATVTRTVQLLGTLQGEQQAMALPKIAGRVTEIARPEGSTVSEGEPILFVQNDVPGMDYKPGPVTAPVAGIVGKVYVEVGQTVAPGMPVAAVSSFSGSVKAKAAISDADLPFVRRGAVAQVTTSALPGETFTGRVTQVSPMLDPMSRSATVEVTLANPGRRLLPGMSVAVRLTVEEKTDVVALPLGALLADGSQRVVVVEDSTARFRDVTIGLIGDELVEVTSGIEPGTRVATTGKERVKDGDRVNPVEAGMP